MGVDRDDALRHRIDIAPDAEVAQAAHGVIGAVRPALVLLDHGDAVGVPTIGARARGVVDGKLGVIGQLGAGQALGPVFVIERSPFAGKILLREGWGGGHGQQQQSGRDACMQLDHSVTISRGATEVKPTTT